MEEYIVFIVSLESNIKFKITILVDEAEKSDDIVLKAYVDGKEVSASDYNYLPAYQKFRDALLSRGYGIKCNGSRINAVQSEMMGANDKIYLVKLGQKALRKDIVSLYDYADINEFPDTQAQKEFFKKWCESI